jgi:hypothetical protein
MIVKLNDKQREHLEKLISSGTASARTTTHARILLKSDCSEDAPHWSYAAIRMALDVSEMTIAHVRKTFAEQGLDAALSRKKPDRVYECCLDGDAEAHLTALACSRPPDGRDRWHSDCSPRRWSNWSMGRPSPMKPSARHTKKSELKPWLKQEWCIPPEATLPLSAAWRMCSTSTSNHMM